MTIQVVVGAAGPSAYYTTDALLQDVAECRVDIIEALPTPYGLIRAGIAPDHQSTKAVSRALATTAT